MSDIDNAIELSLEEGKARLDATMKKFLANKKILAVLLKKYVREFKDCTVEDIENKYIDTESISVGETPIEKDFTNLAKRGQKEQIEGIANEDTSLNEGRITYDVIFKAVAPTCKDEQIGLYINVEAQGKFYPGYPLETRAIYYASRRFSSQLTSINESTNYKDLEKVYSIWVCVGDVPDKAAGTVSLYHFSKKDLVGDYAIENTVYDKINVLMIRLNEHVPVQDDFLNALKVIFSDNTTGKQKRESLQKVGIETEISFSKEVDTMCNYSDWIESRGEAKGILGAVNLLRGFNISDEEIKAKIMSQYSLTEPQAIKYLFDAANFTKNCIPQTE